MFILFVGKIGIAWSYRQQRVNNDYDNSRSNSGIALKAKVTRSETLRGVWGFSFLKWCGFHSRSSYLQFYSFHRLGSFFKVMQFSLLELSTVLLFSCRARLEWGPTKLLSFSQLTVFSSVMMTVSLLGSRSYTKFALMTICKFLVVT